MAEIYLAIDGDDVGHRIEYFVLINDIQPLIGFSNGFQSAMLWLEEKLVTELQATIVFSGGDSLLAFFPLELYSKTIIEKLSSNFATRAGSTLSIGLGNTPRNAYFALKLAKASGKNCIRRFEEFADE